MYTCIYPVYILYVPWLIQVVKAEWVLEKQNFKDFFLLFIWILCLFLSSWDRALLYNLSLSGTQPVYQAGFELITIHLPFKKNIWNWLSKLLIPVITAASLRSMDSIKYLWYKLLNELTRIDSLDFSDSVHKTFVNLWKNKKNNDSVWVLLVYLGKFTKHKSELRDKINQFLIS